MGDGAAKRGSRGALGIDVDVLMVVGGIGELVDAGLFDRQPVGDADFPADIIRQFRRLDSLVHAGFPTWRNGAV